MDGFQRDIERADGQISAPVDRSLTSLPGAGLDHH